jgi:hypothetical protein
MDGEEYFDWLYSQFCLHFPCYALRRPDGKRYADESASDGSRAVVLLTDEDLVERYSRDRELAKHLTVVLADVGSLARFLRRLPPDVTHVTFDPSDGFHRRYPVDVIRDCLDLSVSDV